jgi:hypothetical protein
MKPKIIWIIVLALGVVLLSQLNSPVLAQGTWTKGSVTRGAWEDNQLRIEVDKIQYMIMPEATVWLSSQTRSGAYEERPLDIRSINRGQEVLMRALGHNVYQIIVVK